MDRAEQSRWRKAAELLDRVLDAPEEQQQDAVNKLGAAHAVLSELLSLYHGTHDASVLDAPIDELLSQMADPAPEPNALEGRVIGQWKLGRELGRGGMSVVYQAERTGHDFQQQAALKILSLAHLGDDFVDGFVRERQILSDLQHPGIASLIDGGITPDGAPYLVMQYVEGERIDRWCKDRATDIRTIASLMLKLCHAVAYAQRHLVVHQDIKPANVLVDEHEQPVLIDFGIARLLRKTGPSDSLRAFTPQFAAPEQRAGGVITTATDVYALGMLFRTLTQVLHVDRDLQEILNAATHADPEQRYSNARILAEDIEAWLDKRPVRARPPTLGYRASRFLTRNRLGVTAAALVLASVLVGLAAALWQARIASTERDIAMTESARAQQVTGFLKDLFRASDPDQARGEVVTARELLDLGARQAHRTMEDTPGLKAEMLILLGDLYRALGELDAAAPLLEEGLNLADEIGGIAARVDARRALAHQRMETGAHEESLSLSEQAEDLLKDAGQIPSARHASLMQPILFSLAELGRPDEAVERGRATLDVVRDRPDLPNEALYDYLYSVANVLLIAEQTDSAGELLQEAAEVSEEIGLSPSEQIALYSNLGGVLDRTGDLEGELENRRKAMALADEIYPPNHPDRARKLSNLGSTLNHLARYTEAEQALREALAIYEKIYDEGQHPRVAAAHNNLALSLVQAGRPELAEPHLTRAREMAALLFGTEDPRYVIATGNLGNLHRELGKLDSAQDLLEANLALRRSILGPDHRLVGSGLTLLANLRLDQGRPEEALRLCEEALDLYARTNARNVRYIIPSMTRRARALAELGRIEEARAEFDDALRAAEPEIADAGRAWPELLAVHAEFLVDQEDPDAQAAVARAIEAHRAMLGAEHPDTMRIAALAQNMRR